MLVETGDAVRHGLQIHGPSRLSQQERSRDPIGFQQRILARSQRPGAEDLRQRQFGSRFELGRFWKILGGGTKLGPGCSLDLSG